MLINKIGSQISVHASSGAGSVTKLMMYLSNKTDTPKEVLQEMEALRTQLRHIDEWAIALNELKE